MSRDFTVPETPAVLVRTPDGGVLRFSTPFHIGRDPDCEVQLDDRQVSRRHAVVSFAGGEWIIRDLQSSNGLFVDGERVQSGAIGEGVEVGLGFDGPVLSIHPETFEGEEEEQPEEEHRGTEDSVILEDLANRYFTDDDESEAGGRTMMIRRAFQKVQQKQRRQHRSIVAVVAIVALGAAAYAYWAHLQVARLQAAAENVFYDMKAFDVSIAKLQQELAVSGTPQGQQQMQALIAQRRQMETNYERYVTELHDRNLDETDRLILKITRLFGECELAAPPEYMREVRRYIQMWKSTSRFTNAVKLAQDLGYTRRIATEFMALDLPPEYFYLALQESSFDRFASGPRTRFGIAKGMWQFIPETGQRYGLKIGPLVSSPLADPKDDRMDWEKATRAAARYVKDIYATDAEASGLLVMASYNWGEHRVIDLVRTLPQNPRDRNFWQLLERYRNRLPGETYNYVFSIVSAAVIGQNPRLFGIDIDNPLKFLEAR